MFIVADLVSLIYFENSFKLFLYTLTGVVIAAIRKFCRSDCYCFFYAVLTYPTHFYDMGYDSTEVASYTLKSIHQYNR